MRTLKFIFLQLIFTTSAYSQAPSIEWQKCYGGTGQERARCIQSTDDGGSIACGSTRFSSGTGDVTSSHIGVDIWVVKLDASGNLQWQKAFGGTGDEDSYSIQQILAIDFLRLKSMEFS